MRRTLALVLGFAAATTLTAGCGSSQHPTRELTQRERDSVLAASPLPGSAVVGKAIDVSDATADRAAAMDSLTQ